MKMTAPTFRKRIRDVAPLLSAVLLTFAQSAGAANRSDMAPNGLWTELREAPRVTCPLDSPLPRPLVAAAACGDADRVRARLAEGADVAATDQRAAFAGRTALHHAAQLGDADSVSLLLEAGADPNAQDTAGVTPLHLLVMRRASGAELPIARQLIEFGADARIRNARGRTPVAQLAAYEMRTVQPLRIHNGELRAMLAAAEAAGPQSRAVAAPVQAPVPEAALPPNDQHAAAEPTAEAAAAPSAAPQAAAAPAPEPKVEPKPEPKAEPKPEPKPEPKAEPKPEPKAEAAAMPDAAASVQAALDAWSAAWSARNVEGYLSHYSRNFKPSDGNTLERWKEQRKERVGKPESISVTLSDIRITVDGTRASARFRQDYQSESFKVVDRKYLGLAKEGTQWKIVEERGDN